MSDADVPAKNITSSKTEPWLDSAAPTRSLADATLDSAGTPGSGVSREERAAPEPTSIGCYQLVRKLGEGGMGQVWLAEQTAPLRRQVALKLIRVGMYDDSVLQRFQSERQSLAIMDHPSIAKVFDAGTAPDGQPYFVMEYVPGVPITQYCDQKRLSIRDRLELFIKTCEGVQHAHQKAIIHRDLKPANILVDEIDGKPTPRIIDFGLAKATGPQLSGESMFTQVGGFVGTPGYMSPEQADSSIADVDTRTDVYSLGVVLYFLLTGFLPFDTEQWQKLPFHEVLRQLREEDPPRPSTKLGREKESSVATAGCRGLQPKQLVNLLHGDLDWIVMKAMEKDRARRYATPSELATDITRYLHHEPVVARPASTGYRLRKYVRRHRVGVAAVTGLAMLLVAFAVAQAAQLRRITRERDRASRITDFMTGMFKVSDPSEARGNSITVREILEKGSKDIDVGLAKDPELQAQMMDVMGNVYSNLGLRPRAQSLLERAVEIRRHALGPEHPETLKSKHDLAWVLEGEGEYAQAEKLQREVLEVQRRVLGPRNADTLASMTVLAGILQDEGRTAEAEKLESETLGIERRVLGPEHPETLRSMHVLGIVLDAEGRYTEAERLQRETLEIQRRVLGPEHQLTLKTMSDLAWTTSVEGRYTEAEKLERETLEIQRRVLGPEHPQALATMSNLAWTLETEAHYAEAEKLQRQTLEIQRRVLGPEHADTLASMQGLFGILFEEGHYIEAEKLERETLEIRRKVLGPEHRDTLVSMQGLSNTLLDEAHYAEAGTLERKTLEIRRRVFGPEHPDTLTSTSGLACILDAAGQHAEAEKLERKVLEVQRRVLGPDHPDTAQTTYILASFAAHGGRRDEALTLLREAMDHGLSPTAALFIERDTNLKQLRGDPRFAALVAHAKQKAAAAQKLN